MEVWWPPIKVYFTPFTNMTLRVFEAFSGVGSQRMALRNLGIDHEVVATSDVDEFTVKSYAAIHSNDKTMSQVTDEEMQDFLEKRNIPLNDKGVRKILKGNKLREFYEACIKSNNLGDISKVVTQDIPDHDLFTYSFPCQDISVAGKGLGLDEGSDTRSGLLWECQKVIAVKKPKYLLLENVKNLVGKKHKPNFDKWLEWLEEQGYTNYWQVLNAKDYGIPQNRERVFVASVLGEHEPYEFPEPVELELRLKDVLEDEVDDKFYLDTDKSKKLIATITDKYDIKEATPTDGGLKKPRPKEVANAIIARYDAGVSNQQSTGTMVIEPKAERIGGIFDKDGKRHQSGSVWDKEQLSPTLDTMQGGWRQPSVVIGASRGRNPENPSDRTVGSPTEQRLEIDKQGTSNTITTVQKDNYVVEPLGTIYAGASERFQRGLYPGLSRTLKANTHDTSVVFTNFLIGSTQKNAGITDGDCTTTLTSAMGTGGGHVPMHNLTSDFRIRKLTPLECWRLMGFSDNDFHKAEEVNSNSQLYKQAGNSIVVDVLEAIFKQLLEEK